MKTKVKYLEISHFNIVKFRKNKITVSDIDGFEFTGTIQKQKQWKDVFDESTRFVISISKDKKSNRDKIQTIKYNSDLISDKNVFIVENKNTFNILIPLI